MGDIRAGFADPVHVRPDLANHNFKNRILILLALIIAVRYQKCDKNALEKNTIGIPYNLSDQIISYRKHSACAAITLNGLQHEIFELSGFSNPGSNFSCKKYIF